MIVSSYSDDEDVGVRDENVFNVDTLDIARHRVISDFGGLQQRPITGSSKGG